MPITPAAQRVQQPTPTGRWKHPKFDEITRRQQSTTFDERNVQAIVVNGAVLIFSFAAFNVVSNVALLRALQYDSKLPNLRVISLTIASDST
jgi:nucleoporin POM34